MHQFTRRGLQLAITAIVLSSATSVAAETPSSEDVTKARATCRAHQQTLQRLERNANWCTDDPALIQARDTAERSCGLAMQLMVAAGIEPKPIAPRAAPPTPFFVVVERVRQESPQATPPQPTAQFAAMEVDCPKGATAVR